MDRDFRLKKRRENELDPEIFVRILRQTAGEEEAAKVYEEWTGEQIPDKEDEGWIKKKFNAVMT